MKNHRFNAEAIASALHDFGIIGIWLFGSAASGEIPDGSDVDIAILFGDNPGFDELTTCRSLLQRAVGVDNIDLVILNGASVILRFEALSGRRILCCDEVRCAEFASLSAREYEDEMAQCYRALHAA